MNIDYIGITPTYESEGAAGGDLRSKTKLFIVPGEITLISTGLKVSIPEGHYGMVLPRSSLCNKKDLMMANSVGIIDSDYRGDIKVPMRNIGGENVIIEEGERIAQLVIVPFVKATYIEVDELNETVRGEGGFGHTGK